MVEQPDFLEDDAVAFPKDGELWGMDKCGEFPIDPPRGNAEPQDGLCNCKLRLSETRYGEIRYCSKTPYWPADDHDEEASDYCRNHKKMDALIERWPEAITHGYFSRHYHIFEQSLDATEFAFAVDIFAGLLGMSKYDYDVDTVRKLVDATGDPLLEDDIIIEVPMPQAEKYQMQASELWYASLDEIVEQRMQNIRITQGVSTSHVVATADEDGVITDRIEEGSEHHLNLPISRLTKDKKERLKIGGVEIGDDDDDGVLAFTTGSYVTSFEDEIPDDVQELDGTFTEEIEAEVEDN